MKRIKRNRNNSKVLTTTMVLVVVGMFIGFAFLSKTLNIGGTIGVNRADWNVKFRNIVVETGSVEAAAPTLSPDETTITITPTLDKLGDYYEFTVEVYNEGGVDAMLQAVPTNPLSTEQQKLLEWSITYDDDVALTVKDKLKSKESDTLRVRVAYKTDVNEEDLGSANTSSISFSVTYIQADSTANVRERLSGTELLIRKANVADKNYAGDTNVVSDEQKKEMFAFDHTSPTTTTDYRYIGKQGEDGPNNYIAFNDETWRIIGVFDGKIKIIRKDGIENNSLVWDYKASGLGSSENGNGSNDWSDAQLMYMLNKDDIDKVLTAKTGYTKTGNLIKDANQNVIYELVKKPSQQASGKQNEYTGENGATTWRGLSSEALGQVAEVTWNLGGISEYSQSVENYYIQERGTTTCYTSGNCTAERPTTWKGKIGLMYPSDYGYTFEKGVDNICTNNLNNCRTSKGAIPTSSWLFESSYAQWTLSPYAGDSYRVMLVYGMGNVFSGYGACNSYGVRPVVFLNSNIRLRGKGTVSNPYKIVES